MSFEQCYAVWFQEHVESSSGERRRRLVERYGEAEKTFVREVWFLEFALSRV